SPYAQPSNKPPPFRVKVYNDRVFDSLVEDVVPAGGFGSTSQGDRSNGMSKNSSRSRVRRLTQHSRISSDELSKAADEAKRKRRYDQHKLQLARQEEEQQSLLRERLAQTALAREQEFDCLRGEVAQGCAFVDELDRVMGISDAAERSKKLKQFEDWDVNVHKAIQERIDAALAGMDPKEINEHRRGDMEKFLATTNSKAAIFRDIIIASEYDPLEPNRRAIKACVGKLHNPCSRVLDKRSEENSLLATEGAPQPPPLGRPMLDVQLWEAFRIKDTPHGFFAKLMSAGGGNSKNKPAAVSKTYQSNFKLDSYDIVRGRDIVTKEFPKGKKTYAAGDEFAPPATDSKSIIGIGS
ncbi:unnamed protein product, partial [Discosporangium mesarthrocarpum]